jgi:hypothetical protein
MTQLRDDEQVLHHYPQGVAVHLDTTMTDSDGEPQQQQSANPASGDTLQHVAEIST